MPVGARGPMGKSNRTCPRRMLCRRAAASLGTRHQTWTTNASTAATARIRRNVLAATVLQGSVTLATTTVVLARAITASCLSFRGVSEMAVPRPNGLRLSCCASWTISQTDGLRQSCCVRTQGRMIPYKPHVPERIEKATWPMRPPRHLMIADLAHAPVRPSFHRRGDEGIRVIAEHLDARGRHTKLAGRLPAIICRLPHEEGCPRDLETHNGAEIPKLNCPERPLVPSDRLRRVGDRNHH